MRRVSVCLRENRDIRNEMDGQMLREKSVLASRTTTIFFPFDLHTAVSEFTKKILVCAFQLTGSFVVDKICNGINNIFYTETDKCFASLVTDGNTFDLTLIA